MLETVLLADRMEDFRVNVVDVADFNERPETSESRWNEHRPQRVTDNRLAHCSSMPANGERRCPTRSTRSPTETYLSRLARGTPLPCRN